MPSASGMPDSTPWPEIRASSSPESKVTSSPSASAWTISSWPLSASRTAAVATGVSRETAIVRTTATKRASAPRARAIAPEVGRASWRERVCQYVEHPVVAGALKKTQMVQADDNRDEDRMLSTPPLRKDDHEAKMS